MFEVGPIFGGFTGFDGGTWTSSRLEQNGFLGGRGDADVKGYFPPVHPVFDEDVRRAREGSRDETWHLFSRVERGVLGDFENPIPDAIVPAAFKSAIVVTVEGVVPKVVLRQVAGVGAAVPCFHEGEAKTVAHCHPKGP